jgi:hypothetical protein
LGTAWLLTDAAQSHGWRQWDVGIVSAEVQRRGARAFGRGRELNADPTLFEISERLPAA